MDTTMEPVTPDGLVKKRIIVAGEGDPAGRGAKATVKYVLRVKGKDVDANDELKFTQGRKKVIPALDAVISGMCVGETCLVEAAPAYAFGRRGLKRKNIAPDSHVQLEIELLAAEGGEEKKALSDMNSRELYEQAMRCKEVGNAMFKEVKFEKAMVQYSQCIRFVNHLTYKSNQKKDKQQQKEEVEANGVDKPEETTTDDETAETNGTVKNDETQNENVTVSNVNNEEQSINSSDQQNGISVVESEEGEDEGFSEATVVSDEVNQGNTTTATTTTTDRSEAQQTDDEDEEEIVTVDATAGGVVVDSSAQTDVADAEAGATGKESDEETKAEETNGEVKEEQEEAKEEEEEEDDVPDEEEIEGLHVTALNNLSLCLVKMEDYKRAVESASVAIQVDAENSKGYYYRGRALVALGEWDKAREDLVHAAKIQPNNMGIRMEITKLDKKRKSFQNLERKQAAAMFA